jgi:hypothetical protein
MSELGDFELTDQNAVTRSYRFPKAKVTVMTVADRTGAEQLAPWIQKIYERYEKRIDIDGIADVSMIPKLFRGMVSEAFRKRLAYSVMLDWSGSIIRRLGCEKGVANLYVIDRTGRIMKQIVGPVSDEIERELFGEIDRII